MSSIRKKLGLVGLLPYSLVVAFVVFWPKPVDSGARGWIASFLDILHAVGVPETFGYNELEFTANIVMFVPLGVFLAMVLRRTRVWWGVIALPLASIFIELIQFFFLDSRVADLRDVIANSIGGWIGVGLVWLCLTILARDHPAGGSEKSR